jgi:hypothetical protein
MMLVQCQGNCFCTAFLPPIIIPWIGASTGFIFRIGISEKLAYLTVPFVKLRAGGSVARLVTWVRVNFDEQARVITLLGRGNPAFGPHLAKKRGIKFLKHFFAIS